jgi:hypothetical protein
MALDRNLNCREFDKFVECDGNPAVRTVDCSAMLPSGYDYLENNPTATTDVFTYKSGGVGGTTLGTITVTYTDSTKCELVSVVRT